MNLGGQVKGAGNFFGEFLHGNRIGIGDVEYVKARSQSFSTKFDGLGEIFRINDAFAGRTIANVLITLALNLFDEAQ